MLCFSEPCAVILYKLKPDTERNRIRKVQGGEEEDMPGSFL